MAAALGSRPKLPLWPVLRAMVRRPDLWSTGVRAGLSLAGRQWWRKPPFLPLPDPEWLKFRLTTAYGGDGRIDDATPFEVDDLITWLEWRKGWPA